MTNKEIDKLLNMLDKKSLEQVKNYLNKEKEKNNKKESQNIFEKYITNYDRNISAPGKLGTVLNIKNDVIVFSNGVSLYYINKDVFNIDTDKIKKSLSYYKGKHRIRIVNDDSVSRYEKSLAQLADTELDFEDIPNTFEVPLTIEYVDEFAQVYYVKNNELIDETFNLSEFKYADKLLNNPKYKICKNNPILYGESDIGKVYILGRKKKS